MMHISTTAALLSIRFLFGGSGSALGIICRGSGMCSLVACGGRSCIAQMYDLVSLLPDNATYAPGAHILCSPKQSLGDGICLFTERYGPASGAQVKAAYDYIFRYGCGKCGSAPFEPAANDVGRGSLTVNVVHNPHCKGICSVSSSSSSSLSSSSFSTRTSSTVPLATAPAPVPVTPVAGRN